MAREIRDYTRDLIIKDGFMKHREPGIVTRWRHRYVVFRTSNAGRFIFTVYRDKPAIPANELTDVPIEDFGGLDSTLKVDGEKNVFAIITNGVTECFAADSPDIVREWCEVLQEYLGQELVMNIEIPYKQKSLKAGKAQMRIRNTGFTITSMDGPPKCMGSWQILHVRKFGGSDSFRFETGSKCPSGEFLYVIKAEDVKRMKELFSELAHHKPIFQNDRTGRRMTQEHKLLQKHRGERQFIGPRLSLPHKIAAPPNNFQYKKIDSDLASRPRSNALVTEKENNQLSTKYSNSSQMKSSPSVSDIHLYSNLPSETYKRKTNSLSTTMLSSQDNIYYNKDAIELQLKMAATNNDSDSDNDDFVDIKPLRNNSANNIYYNIRDSELLKKAKAKQFNETDAPAYENIKFKRDSVQSNDRQSNPDDHFYTNLEIMSRTDIDSTCSLDSSTEVSITISREFDIKRERNSTLVEELSPVPSEHGNSLTSSMKSCSDSEGSDTSTPYRRRTTSIVEHVIISADQNTRSCENLLSNDSKMWKQNKDSTDGNYSDSELLNEASIVRKKSNTLVQRDHDDYDYPLVRSSSKSPNRINEYDHLVIQERNSNTDTTQPGPQDLIEQDTVPLHRPTLPDESTLMKSFQSRNRRTHLYEDIDVDDDERQLSSCSPESPSSILPHIGKQESYTRKVSVLGREHCYESVLANQTSPSPPPPSIDTSPMRRTQDNKVSPSKFNLSKKSKKRPTLPLQSMSLDTSFDSSTSVVPSPSVLNNNRNSKKPIPTPRQLKNAATSDSITTSQDNGPGPIILKEPSYVNGSVIQEQINALNKPNLPPKPRKLLSHQSERILQYRADSLRQERFSSSDLYALPYSGTARIKPESSLQNQQHYAEIYVQIEPTSSISSTRDTSKLSQSSRRQPVSNASSNYMKIDHFKTEQLQNLIEQRQIEKNFAAV